MVHIDSLYAGVGTQDTIAVAPIFRRLDRGRYLLSLHHLSGDIYEPLEFAAGTLKVSHGIVERTREPLTETVRKLRSVSRSLPPPAGRTP